MNSKILFSKLNIAIAISLVVLLTTPLAFANHAWGKYHWERSANPLELSLGDNVSSEWDASLALASSDWSISSVLNTTVVPGGTTGIECDPTGGQVEVCNANYGDNGWLGLAQIWASRGSGHITQGLVKMNDTYYGSSSLPYGTDAWRNLVVCQEIGHTFGLGHQDETFDNGNLNTCMDYTSNPDSNQHPNQHDYNQLEAIYSHLDGTKVKGGGGGGGRGGRNRASENAHLDVSNPSAWGEAISTDAQGKQSLYVRENGDELIFTHVFWIPGEGELDGSH